MVGQEVSQERRGRLAAGLQSDRIAAVHNHTAAGLPLDQQLVLGLTPPRYSVLFFKLLAILVADEVVNQEESKLRLLEQDPLRSLLALSTNKQDQQKFQTIRLTLTSALQRSVYKTAHGTHYCEHI